MLAEKFKEQKCPITKKEEPKDLIYDYIDQYIRDHELTRVKGSMVVYKFLKKHLKNYQKHNRFIVRFDKIDYSFMQSFQNFLVGWKEINEKTGRVQILNNITIAKQLSTLKTFLGYARREGIKVNEGYKDFVIKKDKLEVIALNQQELDKLLSLDLKHNKNLIR